MMEKLTIEHLAPYLPYKLFVNDLQSELQTIDTLDNEIMTRFRGHLYNFYSFDEIKPILHPLSDLTKENIIKIQENNFISEMDFKRLSKLTNLTDCSYIIVNELLKHHFDVFGLIHKGLAIDINTLKQ